MPAVEDAVLVGEEVLVLDVADGLVVTQALPVPDGEAVTVAVGLALPEQAEGEEVAVALALVVGQPGSCGNSWQ